MPTAIGTKTQPVPSHRIIPATCFFSPRLEGMLPAHRHCILLFSCLCCKTLAEWTMEMSHRRRALGKQPQQEFVLAAKAHQNGAVPASLLSTMVACIWSLSAALGNIFGHASRVCALHECWWTPFRILEQGGCSLSDSRSHCFNAA